MGRKATAHPGRRSGVAQLSADPGRRARPAAGRTADDAEQGADRELRTQLEPLLEALPPPAVHPDLAPPAPFASADQDRTCYPVKVGLGERERLADPQTGPPEHNDQSPQPDSLRSLAGGPHDRDDLLHRGRVRRIAKPLVSRRPTLMEAGQRGRRAPTAGAIEQRNGLHDVLLEDDG